MKKLIIFLTLLYPVYIIGYGLIVNDLTADPIDYIIDTSGEWALGMLVLTLALTPLRKWLRHAEFSQYKRMFGLFAFFYATLHLLTHVGLDHSFNWSEIYKQLVTKKFMFVGFLAWVLLIPLAITSNTFSIRLLKGKWKILHKLTYVVGVLAILHYVWLVKTIIYEPLIYTIVMFILLLTRVGFENVWVKIKKWILPFVFLAPISFMVYLANTTDVKHEVVTLIEPKVSNSAYYECYEKLTDNGVIYEDKLLHCNELWKDIK